MLPRHHNVGRHAFCSGSGTSLLLPTQNNQSVQLFILPNLDIAELNRVKLGKRLEEK